MIDSKGRPQSKAQVLVYPVVGRGRDPLKYMHTDAEGKFDWDAVPTGELVLTPLSPGTLVQKVVKARAGDQPVEIVVPAPVFVRGKVTDAATGEGIRRFTIHVYGDRDQITHTGARAEADGSYDVAARDGASHYRAEIIADGYFPERSGELAREDDAFTFNARLTKGSGPVVTIVKADGKPAAGADVLLWDRGLPNFVNGKPVGWRMLGTTLTADAAGKVALPPQRGICACSSCTMPAGSTSCRTRPFRWKSSSCASGAPSPAEPSPKANPLRARR